MSETVTPDGSDEAELLAAAGVDLALYISLAYPSFRLGAHHLRIVEKLEAVAAGTCKRLLISMPPRHGKSLTASEHFPAWYLGRNPTHQIISATYGQALANDFGLKVRNQVGDPLFTGIFPGVTLTKDSSSAKKFRTPQGGVYVAIGRGGSATGRGAHLLLIDDPYKDMAEADSSAIRARVQSFYTSAAYTRLMPGGAIVIIHTRWRDDDLIGWLRRDHKHEKWDVLEMPAIDKAGQALWPSDYPLPALRRIERTLTAREWSALYQQRPYAEEGAIIKRHWWQPWLGARPKSPDMVIVSVDSAMTADSTNDPSAITIWFVCADKSERSCALLVGALREWLEFADLLDAIEDAERMFGCRNTPTRILVENKANGLPIIQELRRRSPHLLVYEAKAKGDKIARANSVTSLFYHDPANDRAGRVYAMARMEAIGDPSADLDEDGNEIAGSKGDRHEAPVFRPWAQMVMDECAAFPLGAHDDLVDSTTHALRHMRDIGVEFFAEDEPPPPRRVARGPLY